MFESYIRSILDFLWQPASSIYRNESPKIEITHETNTINAATHTHTGGPCPAEGKSERSELGDQGDLRQVTSEDCSIVILNP